VVALGYQVVVRSFPVHGRLGPGGGEGGGRDLESCGTGDAERPLGRGPARHWVLGMALPGLRHVDWEDETDGPFLVRMSELALREHGEREQTNERVRGMERG